MQNVILQEIDEHIKVATIAKELSTIIENASDVIINALKNGNKVLLFGNGGSAADAQHIAAELTGRYKTERISLPAIALSTDTSALTAIGNDYGYEYVFQRQLQGLAKAGDVAFGISTSGNSKNVLNALLLARQLGCKTIGLSGNNGGKMNEVCDVNIVVASDNTPRIQECHIMIGHIICQLIDNAF